MELVPLLRINFISVKLFECYYGPCKVQHLHFPFYISNYVCAHDGALEALTCLLSWRDYSEVESRTQGSRPRPRTQKNPRPRTAFPRTDTLEAKDRNARGQGPRTQAQALSKKRSSQKFFKRSQKKKGLHKNFQAIPTKKNVF